MEKIKVGIVGMRMIGLAHLDALRRLPEVEVVAICGRDAQSTRAMAERQGIPQWYSDYRMMIGLAGIDAVHNCTPNAIHDSVNRAAIDAGKHIYAEKPLSNSPADAKEVWQRAERAGVVHGLNHQYRMNAAVQEMRARVARGDVGRLFYVSGHYHQQSSLYETEFRPRMIADGLTCTLADIGTHWLDTVRCVTGQNVTRVFANIQTVHPERVTPDGDRVAVKTDDICSVIMSFDGGIQGMTAVSKVSAGHMNDLAVNVFGQQCSMSWAQENPNHIQLGVKAQPNGDMQMSPQLADPAVRNLVTLPGGHPLGWNDAILASMREFYGAIRGEVAQSAMRCATFADGFEGAAFVEAALRSYEQGGWAAVER